MVGDAAEIVIVENESRNSRLISLKEILKHHFIIPVYQRPYAWNSENFRDLLNTIKESREQKLPAFFGSIIVAEINEGSRMTKQYILIDGQQRITSFLILLKLIRKKLKALEDKLKEKRAQAVNNDEVDTIVEKNIKVRDIADVIDNTLSRRETLKREQSDSNIDNDSLLALETDVLKYIFGAETLHGSDVKKIPDVFEDETKDFDECFLEYASDVVERSQFCFLVVQGKLSEDYAIDIFNTFNSTGEPLTAFEILKSIVHKAMHKKDKKGELTKKLNIIEKDLSDKTMKRAKQNKYTDRLLLFLSMIHTELNKKKFSSFREKKELIDKISDEYKKNIPDYISTLCSLHKFTIENWEGKNVNMFTANSEEAVCFEFLKSIGHDRTIPILFKFADSKERGGAVKACTAFTCLWRGVAADGGTDRIDNQYKIVTERLFSEDYDIDKLKNVFCECLSERWKNKKGGNRNMSRSAWVEEFANIDIYKRIRLARFILFAVFHKSTFDVHTRNLVRAKLKFITRDNYEEYDYKTIEHIVPQSYRAVNKIGNLVLLPININQQAGKKDFVSKRKIYEKCLEKKDIGDGMPYLEILKEVVSYDDNCLDECLHLNDEAITERGRRLGHAVWETLATDWLGWTDKY